MWTNFLSLCAEQLRFFMPSPDQTVRLRPNVFRLSVRPFDRLSQNLWTQYFEKKWTDFDENWHKWSTWQGHETVNLCESGGESQGHVKLKIDLEIWWRHCLDSSRFSSCYMYLKLKTHCCIEIVFPYTAFFAFAWNMVFCAFKHLIFFRFFCAACVCLA